ncbi:hypothetical protein [Sphingobacterium faecale]|uniref:Lipoprotein n=1 Tax=Sphingobacterium faecale TaxID=2803775 RepID=A0ABS1QY27_9SPHI|nr:hypothetical protein [Sphingobacterium faecale]MBL1407204.1 hypothetical protein [Sphingobacterium faecale]
MKKKGMIMSMAIAGLVTVTSCNNQEKKDTSDTKVTETSEMRTKDPIVTDISYVVAKRYFVKNNVKSPIANTKIQTQDEFDKVFEAAAVMGEDGLPTVIDFDKQYVIAVVLPETDMETTLNPVSLQKSESGDVVFSYKKVIGEKQSHVSVPALVIVVDKTISGDIVTKEIGK